MNRRRPMKRRRRVPGLALLTTLWLTPAIAQPCMDADLLLRNGHIITMDGAKRVVSAMAVRNGRILALGDWDRDALAGCASSRTQSIDLHGRTVLPGLIDVHTHAIEWVKGLLRGEIDAGYPAVHAISEIKHAVAQRAATLPRGEWIVGSGWDDSKLAEHRYITRQDLDAASPDHPVYLRHVSGHLSVANSEALTIANITKATQNPEGGVIERDESGEPTGILKDTAMGLMGGILPGDPPDIDMRAARVVSEKAAAVGLTTIHDIFISPDEMRGYQEAHRLGWLKVRVQMSPRIGNIAD